MKAVQHQLSTQFTGPFFYRTVTNTAGHHDSYCICSYAPILQASWLPAALPHATSEVPLHPPALPHATSEVPLHPLYIHAYMPAVHTTLRLFGHNLRPFNCGLYTFCFVRLASTAATAHNHVPDNHRIRTLQCLHTHPMGTMQLGEHKLSPSHRQYSPAASAPTTSTAYCTYRQHPMLCCCCCCCCFVPLPGLPPVTAASAAVAVVERVAGAATV
jgi:hypothetical protein